MTVRNNCRICIMITFTILFLSFIFLHQSTNNGKTLPEDLGPSMSSERGKGVTYITKQTKDIPLAFQDADEASNPNGNVHSVSKPTAVHSTSKLLPTHTSAHKFSLPANTSPVKFDDRLIDFTPHGNDTMVVIHIQKTGGKTFVGHLHTVKQDGKDLCEHAEDQKWFIRGRELLRDMYRCPRNWNRPDEDPWLLTERTLHIPWICGVHSSYADFKYCLPRLKNRYVNPHRNFQYATMLRHPVIRYISEYVHVRRGATWLPDHMCGGRKVTKEEMPPCYPGYYEDKQWLNATLEEFLSCESNWGNNRQVMMLADLEEVGCYDKSRYAKKEREARMLESAKRNLEEFAFFGITEYLEESGILFEKRLGMKFGKPMKQLPFSALCSAPILQSVWTKDMYEKIANVNKLDMALYNYALQLFTKRLKALGILIDPSHVDKVVKTIIPDPVGRRNKNMCK